MRLEFGELVAWVVLCALAGFFLGAMGRGLLWGFGAAGVFAATGLVLAGVPYLLGLLSGED